MWPYIRSRFATAELQLDSILWIQLGLNFFVHLFIKQYHMCCDWPATNNFIITYIYTITLYIASHCSRHRNYVAHLAGLISAISILIDILTYKDEHSFKSIPYAASFVFRCFSTGMLIRIRNGDVPEPSVVLVLRWSFSTIERLLKTIFFIHFVMYCIARTVYGDSRDRDNVPYIFLNLFLLLVLFTTLATNSNRHMVAQIAVMINLACILMDDLNLLDMLHGPGGYKMKYQYNPVPYYINFALRSSITALLLSIRLLEPDAIANNVDLPATAHQPTNELPNNNAEIIADEPVGDADLPLNDGPND